MILIYTKTGYVKEIHHGWIEDFNYDEVNWVEVKNDIPKKKGHFIDFKVNPKTKEVSYEYFELQDDKSELDEIKQSLLEVQSQIVEMQLNEIMKGEM